MREPLASSQCLSRNLRCTFSGPGALLSLGFTSLGWFAEGCSEGLCELGRVCMSSLKKIIKSPTAPEAERIRGKSWAGGNCKCFFQPVMEGVGTGFEGEEVL